MPERKPKTIYFPHVIPGKTLAGKEHTFNCINGGMRRVADLGLDPTTFYGGNALEIGMVKEYGFYAIPANETHEILGFYLYNPDTVTPLGKKVLKEHLAIDTLVYGYMEEVAALARDPKEMEALIKEYEQMGGRPSMVRHVHVKELRSMIDALKSGTADKPMAELETPVTSASLEDAKITKPVSKGNPSKAIVNQVKRASGK